MNLIDHSEAIQAIKDCYAPRYDIHPQAISEAAALWGGQPNASGVFPAKPEQLVNVGQCRGEIQFYETSKNYWLIGIDVSCSFKGWSYAPSVWNTIGYHSYTDARLAGIAQLINCFEGIIRDSSSMNSETNLRHAHKVVKQLQAARTPQLTLFAL